MLKRYTDPFEDFERFALDHEAHRHCQGCGGCILDPSHLVQMYPCWCVSCRDRIKANTPDERLPWRGMWEFNPLRKVMP